MSGILLLWIVACAQHLSTHKAVDSSRQSACSLLDFDCDGVVESEYISAGGHHSCGLNSLGAIECWGANDSGQGDGPIGYFTQIAGGRHHNCAVDDTSNIQCFGKDDGGQSSPPTATFAQVASGIHHSCAIDTQGNIQCWGIDDGSRDDFGQVSKTPFIELRES